MKRKRYAGRLAISLLWLSLMAGMLTACRNGRLVFTTGFGRNEVFRIGSQVCTTAEIRVYLTNEQNRYESVYGSQIWSASLDGVTMEESVKETVLAKCAQIKTMAMLAESKGVKLDDGERIRVDQAAEEYFGSLNDVERERMGADLTLIRKMYTEYALADKVYRHIIRDVNPEISDDEARIITVQHILFCTSEVNEEGKRQEFSERARQELYQEACGIRLRAMEKGEDFLELAGRYSDDPTITYSFGKGKMNAAFEEAAFALETGEISQVVETEAGYHIIKCITTFDREETNANKQVIIEERRREVFGEEYHTFVEPLTRQLNTKLWRELPLLHEEEITTQDYFQVYDKYFPRV